MLNYKGLLLGQNGSWQPAVVVEGQRHGKSVIVHIEGVEDRDRAAALIGADLGVEKLPDTEEGHYYWSDLIGLKVVHRDGTELGSIKTMLETGAHDVMVVESEQGGKTERLIPFVKDKFVLDVDLDNGRINVDWEWD